MSEYAGAETTEHPVKRVPISVPWVVLSAVLCGLGLLSLTYWLVTQEWILLGGVLPLALGGYMLFSPRAGWDHA